MDEYTNHGDGSREGGRERGDRFRKRQGSWNRRQSAFEEEDDDEGSTKSKHRRSGVGSSDRLEEDRSMQQPFSYSRHTKGGVGAASLGVTTHIPKFLQSFINSNPNVLKQLPQSMSDAARKNKEREEEKEKEKLRKAEESGVDEFGREWKGKDTDNPTAGKREEELEERERPDSVDELPVIANIESLDEETKSKLVQMGIQARPQAPKPDLTATTSTSSSSPISLSSSHPALTAVDLLIERKQGSKRERVEDDEADKVEAITGKHIYRKAKKTNPTVNEEIKAEEKKKKEERAKAVSKLSFEEEEEN